MNLAVPTSLFLSGWLSRKAALASSGCCLVVSTSCVLPGRLGAASSDLSTSVKLEIVALSSVAAARCCLAVFSGARLTRGSAGVGAAKGDEEDDPALAGLPLRLAGPGLRWRP